MAQHRLHLQSAAFVALLLMLCGCGQEKATMLAAAEDPADRPHLRAVIEGQTWIASMGKHEAGFSRSNPENINFGGVDSRSGSGLAFFLRGIDRPGHYAMGSSRNTDTQPVLLVFAPALSAGRCPGPYRTVGTLEVTGIQEGRIHGKFSARASFVGDCSIEGHSEPDLAITEGSFCVLAPEGERLVVAELEP